MQLRFKFCTGRFSIPINNTSLLCVHLLSLVSEGKNDGSLFFSCFTFDCICAIEFRMSAFESIY